MAIICVNTVVQSSLLKFFFTIVRETVFCSPPLAYEFSRMANMKDQHYLTSSKGSFFSENEQT